MSAFKKAKLRAGPETRIRCIAHIMNLIVKAIMRPITGKHDNDDNDNSEEDDEIGGEGIVASGDSDGDDGDDDDKESDDASDDDEGDEDEDGMIDGRGGEPVLDGEDTDVDVPSDVEDERLPDDEVNPGLDREDAGFLDGRDFLDGVDEFIAERDFTFLKPDSADLKDLRKAIRLVSHFVCSSHSDSDYCCKY
jgi:hypothetical protein